MSDYLTAKALYALLNIYGGGLESFDLSLAQACRLSGNPRDRARNVCFYAQSNLAELDAACDAIDAAPDGQLADVYLCAGLQAIADMRIEDERLTHHDIARALASI